MHPIRTRYVVTDDAGTGFCHMYKKTLTLGEELVRWADSNETRPFDRLRARSAIDVGGTYAMPDEAERPIGALMRAGVRSMPGGTWEVPGVDGGVLATVEEDSAVYAALRRTASLPRPVGVTVTAPGGQVVGLDPHLALAPGIALDLLEAR